MKFPVNSIPQRLVNKLIFEEGFSGKMYKDTRGYNTIGYGFCLDKLSMPRTVAKYWLRILIRSTAKRICKHPDMGDAFNRMDANRQEAIVMMGYQLGIDGLAGFKRMWSAIKKQDYDTAAKECIDSSWYDQTRERAERIAEVISSGSNEIYDREMRNSEL